MCDPDPNTPNIQITFPNDTMSAIVLSAYVLSATSNPALLTDNTFAHPKIPTHRHTVCIRKLLNLTRLKMPNKRFKFMQWSCTIVNGNLVCMQSMRLPYMWDFMLACTGRSWRR